MFMQFWLAVGDHEIISISLLNRSENKKRILKTVGYTYGWLCFAPTKVRIGLCLLKQVKPNKI